LKSNKTTCPLDCYDGCSIVYEDGKLKGDKNHLVTKGYLCSKMNKFLKYDRLKSALYNGKKIDLQEALKVLAEKIHQYKNENNIFFTGSGNLGRLQNMPKEFFSKFNFTQCEGSLCDGAGDAGIQEGRGANLIIPPSQIENSEVVVIWGRNIQVSNSHLMPFLKDKKIVVIDPVENTLAKKADLFLKILPRGDYYLALLVSRILYISQNEDIDFIESKTNNFNDFVELFESIPIKKLSQKCDIPLEAAWEFAEMITSKKVTFLVGIAVQKYFIGHFVLRAIDSLAAMLGLFGKGGCGVSFLSNSFYGFKSTIASLPNKTDLPTVDFSKYSFTFIQNSNPLVSMPNSKKIKEGIEKSKFVVYFGLYENETSRLADLVIPAVDFLSKNDIRTTYGHEFIGMMPKLKESECGISEYNLTNYLMQKFFGTNLKSEQEYIAEIVSSNSFTKDGYLASKIYEKIPYSDGFYTDDGKFNFLDEFEDDFEQDFEDDNQYYILTIKNKYSLNSSFKCNNFLYIPPILGYKDEDKVELTSLYGKAEFVVKIDKRLRRDCFLTYSGNAKYNYLTPSICSLKGTCAVFQELKVSMKKVTIQG